MGANKVFLIKLLNNFMEWIFIGTRSEGAQAPPALPGSLPLLNMKCIISGQDTLERLQIRTRKEKKFLSHLNLHTFFFFVPLAGNFSTILLLILCYQMMH